MELKKVIIAISIIFLSVNCKKESKKNISTEPKSEILNEKIIFKETPKEIAEKLKPKNSKITHEVIETEIWGRKNSIIAFYETKYIDSVSTNRNYERQYVEAYILVFQNKTWKKIFINKFEDDNVFTEIQSVFFSNADKDKEKELIIFTTCNHRLQYLYDGTEYSTWVFDNLNINEIPKEAKFLNEISEKLNGGFEGYLEDNENSKAKFKNANDIKKELKRLGF
jgi:hypothetical protein